MIKHNHNWAVVLAGGDGTRLRPFTTDNFGMPVPKQFCSLHGGDSLLGSTLKRASRVVAGEHIVSVVAARHRRWWQSPMRPYTAKHVVVQPDNRGTGIGILLPTLRVLHQDPDANIVFLPSDHFFENESLLASAIDDALAGPMGDGIVLLGIAPESPDPELGYILPSTHAGTRRYHVAHFVEKPDVDAARNLIRLGAAWNSFIFVANGALLLKMLEQKIPEAVTALHPFAGVDDPDGLALAYRNLPTVDFSRDILSGNACRLQMLSVPHCGWSDLGTAARVRACLARNNRVGEHAVSSASPFECINLADVFSRLQPAR